VKTLPNNQIITVVEEKGEQKDLLDKCIYLRLLVSI
jgi:hypothetical protein